MTTAELDGQSIDNQAFRAYEHSMLPGWFIHTMIKFWSETRARFPRISTRKDTMDYSASDPTKAVKYERSWTAQLATPFSQGSSARTKHPTTTSHSSSTGRTIP